MDLKDDQMIKIDFDTINIQKYIDSNYNHYDIMSAEALINGEKATIFIGKFIRITNGHVTVAYESKDKEYNTIYGEPVDDEIEKEVMSIIKRKYNTDDVFELIDTAIKNKKGEK